MFSILAPHCLGALLVHPRVQGGSSRVLAPQLTARGPRGHLGLGAGSGLGRLRSNNLIGVGQGDLFCVKSFAVDVVMWVGRWSW